MTEYPDALVYISLVTALAAKYSSSMSQGVDYRGTKALSLLVGDCAVQDALVLENIGINEPRGWNCVLLGNKEAVICQLH